MAIGKVHTKVITSTSGRLVAVIYHNTTVVKLAEDGTITLNTGGYKTATTKRRMNEASDEFGLGYKVFAKKGEWYAELNDRRVIPFDYDVLILAYHFKG